MTINISLAHTHEQKARITVVGVGGAGGNALDNMITEHLEGVEFLACNTDAQALAHCLAERKVQLGVNITQGLGAGAKPEVGRAAAEESLDEILDHLAGSNMVFITAGMGGGTGTGAAPVIARAVREQGALTIGVVTKPFHFEGAERMRIAEAGILELQEYVDTLIVIPNQNLFRLASERTPVKEAFKLADNVLYMGVRGVTDLMMVRGLINLDFADVRTIMSVLGKCMMGTGEAEGERRAIEAAEGAISNPLLEEVSMKGARACLINVTADDSLTLFEVDEAINRIREELDADAHIIFGAVFDNSMNGRLRISVVATGIDSPTATQAAAAKEEQPAEETRAAAAPSGFRFPPQSPASRPYPAVGARPRTGGVPPALGLERPSRSEPVAPAAGVQGAAAGPGRPRPVARSESRSGLFDRMRQFTRMRQPTAPQPQAAAPSQATHREEVSARDEIGDVPAFLRRKEPTEG